MTSSNWKIIARISLCVLFVILFVFFSAKVYKKNNSFKNDQYSYYLNTGELVKSKYTYMGDRNRGPLYIYILSLVYSDNKAEFFNNAKILNSILTFFCIILIYIYVLKKKLMNYLQGYLFVAVITFSCLIFKSAVINVEPIFYTIFFICILEYIDLFKQPSVTKSIKAGFLSALCFLSKASNLPLIIVYMAFFLGTYLLIYIVRKISLKELVQKLFIIVVFGISTLFFLFPYLYENYKLFGNPFFNVNTEYYIWTNSEQEIKESAEACGDVLTWRQCKYVEKIPSLKNYIKNNSVYDIILRIKFGVYKLIQKTFINNYGYTFYVLMALFLFTANVFILFKRLNLNKIMKEDIIKVSLLLFLTIIYIIYILIFIIYMPVSRGRRFFLTLYIPTVYALFKLSENSKFIKYSNIIIITKVLYDIFMLETMINSHSLVA